jgi:rhodanese-related sulfurtransferase
MAAALAGIATALVVLAIVWLRFHHDVVRVFEARERLRRGGILLDVDLSGDFAQRHPRLAVNVPLHELRHRAHELGTKDTPIVVYAHRWRDGVRAVRLLRALGFESVYDAAGVRVKQRLGEAAVRADAERLLREERLGIPEDIDLSPEPS